MHLPLYRCAFDVGNSVHRRGACALLRKKTGKEDPMSSDLMWNLIGLLGLVGLIGLLPQHEDDSYHPSSFDE